MTSEEIAQSAADLATVAALRAELEAAQSIIDGLRRSFNHAQERAQQAEARLEEYAEIDRIMSMSDEAILEDARARSIDPEQNAAEMRQSFDTISKLLRRAEQAEAERDYWRVQEQDTLTELHEVERARNVREAELLAELHQWRAASSRMLAVDASTLSYETLRGEIRLMQTDDRARLWAYPNVSALLGDVAQALERMKG